MARTSAHSYVLRDTFTTVVFWLAAALGVILIGDLILRGDLPAFATTTPVIAFVVWVLWMVLFRPHVRYGEERAVVTNIGRIHVLPWSRVVTVRQNLSLAFVLDDGRRITAMGVTAPRDRGLILAGLTRGKMGVGSADFHHQADALRPIQAAAVATDDPVTSRWDVVPLAIGAVLAVAVLIDVVVLLAL